MAGLTTHVLDTARGVPAAGLRIELYRLDDAGGRTLIKAAMTNADGRPDKPMLEPAATVRGRYELAFAVADYFRAAGVKLADPPFYDVITVRFAIADPATHYHVPLLVSPFGYTTYRGS